jgi:hypothetical protein
MYHGPLVLGDKFGLIALVVASAAGILALMAAAVAVAYLRSARPVFARLYWIVFWLTIVGHVCIVAADPGLLLFAWIGPSVFNRDQQYARILYLNMLVPPALGFFFSAPWLRTYLEKRGASPPTAV